MAQTLHHAYWHGAWRLLLCIAAPVVRDHAQYARGGLLLRDCPAGNVVRQLYDISWRALGELRHLDGRD